MKQDTHTVVLNIETPPKYTKQTNSYSDKAQGNDIYHAIFKCPRCFLDSFMKISEREEDAPNSVYKPSWI